jgi:hypothetical protein
MSTGDRFGQTTTVGRTFLGDKSLVRSWPQNCAAKDIAAETTSGFTVHSGPASAVKVLSSE